MITELKSASTEELKAEYEPMLARFNSLRKEYKKLEAEISPLRAELAERENKKILVLNAVMQGQQGLLRAVGTPEEVIKEAEEEFARLKAAKEAARQASEGLVG